MRGRWQGVALLTVKTIGSQSTIVGLITA